MKYAFKFNAQKFRLIPKVEFHRDTSFGVKSMFIKWGMWTWVFIQI